jgi:hypothetical protein
MMCNEFGVSAPNIPTSVEVLHCHGGAMTAVLQPGQNAVEGSLSILRHIPEGCCRSATRFGGRCARRAGSEFVMRIKKQN